MTVPRAIPITSADNTQFKQLKKIATSARQRRETGQTLLDGVHLLTALAHAGGTLRSIILRMGAEHLPEIEQCLSHFGNTPVLLLSPTLFDALSVVETPVGILGLVAIPQAVERVPRCGVLLENIQDPGNVGGIFRTAAAAGCDAMYLSSGCAEAWSPKALRAGMGAQFSIAIYEQYDLSVAAQKFDMVVATTPTSEQSIYALDLAGSVAFVFGNEGAGLSSGVLRYATHRIKIPMPGNVESLNVAAAAAVCLYERVRQLSAQ